MTLKASTLNNNSAFSGGAILNNGTLTLSQCTLAANTGDGADGQGGAIYAGAHTLAVTQSTISGNTASEGGGIYNAGGTLTWKRGFPGR
jgi:predicted outer membrane repeat protein